jgi:hypothetical protein
MSSNYFKQPQQYNGTKRTNTNTNTNGFKTSFNTRSAEVAAVYVAKESDFPELVPAKKKSIINADTDCKYSNIAASTTETKIDETIIIPDGCTQIILNKKTGKSEIRLGKQNQTKLEPVIDNIIDKLENNWNKYEAEYDSINGEGAYFEAHYIKPIYPLLDEEYETESEFSDYSAETDMDNI